MSIYAGPPGPPPAPITPDTNPPIRPGLCSVTFRDLTVDDVVARAVDAGLESIEWGADVHAPADDPGALEEVRAVTESAGLTICSYGSYFRAGPDEDAQALMAAATRLGTGRVRVWAGQTGSADTSPVTRAEVTARLRGACDIAAGSGVELALEFHRNTLTDTVPSTLQLLADVDKPNLSSYWQPPVGLTDADTLAGLAQVRAHVRTAHVFSWAPDGTRQRLHTRAGMWRTALSQLAAGGARHCTDALLEFVPGGDPDLLGPEAATLRGWLATAQAEQANQNQTSRNQTSQNETSQNQADPHRTENLR